MRISASKIKGQSLLILSSIVVEISLNVNKGRSLIALPEVKSQREPIRSVNRRGVVP